LTQNQVSVDDLLSWVRERLEHNFGGYERNACVVDQMVEADLHTKDVLEVLRNAKKCSQTYDGGCFVVRGQDVDGRLVSVVVAPPSDKNRVRVVKVWLGE
jgi:Domain of unknown function (DUF4258)